MLLEKSLALWRQFGQRWLLPYILEGLAEVALMQEEYRQAATQLAQILALFQEFGFGHGIVQTLEQFARAAAGQAQLERAARLWGAAQTQRQVISAGIPLGDRRSYDHAAATARAQLGEEAFAAAWAEGRAMTLEQAIAYALEGSEVDAEKLAQAMAAAKQSR